jgi:hypothetical protein
VSKKNPALKIEDLSPRQQEPQELTTAEAEGAKGGNLRVGEYQNTTRTGDDDPLTSLMNFFSLT